MTRKAQGDGFAPVVVAAVLIVPALLFLPGARDPFRLPKLLASEWLGLLSVLLLCFRLWAVERLTPRGVLALDPLRAVAPLWIVASLGWLTSSHREHLSVAWWSLTVGALCMVAWSLGLPRIRRLLDLLVVPGVILAGLAILDVHGLFELVAGEASGERMRITSLAGNVGELGSYLVLPAVICLANLVLELGRHQRRGPALAGWAIALAIVGYGLVVTQSIAGLVAFAASSLLLLWHATLRRSRLIAWAAVVLVVLSLAVSATPLRQRVISKTEALARGDLNELLTGRLDGWRAALEMVRQHPISGVGIGGYAAEYSTIKLTLIDRGVPFWGRHGLLSTFGNAHNEFLEVAAEMGLLGVFALGGGLWVLFRRLYRSRRRGRGSRRERVDRGLGWAIVGTAGILALGHFPFRTALVGYPLLLGLSWILSSQWVEESER